MKFPTDEELEKLRAKYPKGTKIRLIHMNDPQPVPSGTIGEVVLVDDAGNIHLNWQNGRSLALIEGVDDFEVIDSVTTVCYGQKQVWNSRKEAITFFLKGMNACEGAERERYTNIYRKLISGLAVCDDSLEGAE